MHWRFTKEEGEPSSGLYNLMMLRVTSFRSEGDWCSPSPRVSGRVPLASAQAATQALQPMQMLSLIHISEGEDKPLKYPSIFFKSDLLVLSKIDLLPYVPFDIDIAAENARKVHPGMEIVKVSCLMGNGLHEWMMWLAERRRAHKQLVQQTAS